MEGAVIRGILMSAEMFQRLTEVILKATSAGETSMARISTDAGFGRNYVSQLLKQKKLPKFDSLTRLCAILGVSPAWVLFGETVTPEDEDLLRRIQALPPEKQKLVRSVMDALDPE
jgi:transcriptional regulator with XRE-family HTH domain